MTLALMLLPLLYVIERRMGMQSGHVLPELVNMAFYDHAGLTRLRSLSKGKRWRIPQRTPSIVHAAPNVSPYYAATIE